ncbi:MAG: MFS transporter [Eubacterium sp.]|nr:MFS transporter [Eubacterium sp.]
MNKNKTLSVSSALIYALGIFGVQIFIGYMNSFQTEFYNKMYSSFDSSIFYASAIIIFAAKLISCLFDPLIGAMIDKSSLKGGKMRPWVLRSALPLAVLTTLIFIYIPFDKFGGKILLYAYITITTILWNIAMSFADIPSQGMLSFLSPDADERNVAASFSNIAKSMALALPGVFVTVVMMLLGMIKGEGNYEDKEYYLITALVFFVLGTALILLMYKKNKEAVESSKSSQTVSIKEMFREMKKNKMIFIVFLINMLGFARSMGLIVCVQANGALIGKINLFGMVMDTTADATWLPGILGGVSGFIGICIVPLINKKLGEKKTYIGFSVATFVFNMAVTIFYWLLPQESALRYGNSALYMIMVFQFLTGFLTAANTYIPLVMTADIVDYRLYKTGERKEGVNYAILSLSIKLSNAICVAVGLLLVAASGYTQVVYETGSIPAKMQNIIMFSYMGFVGVSAFISAIPMFFYKIDNKTKEEMRQAQ